MSAETEENEYANTPRVTPIISAAKITGKTTNGLSIGVLEALTAEGKAEIDSLGERTYQTVEPLSNYFVSRVMKDFGGGKTVIGGAYTNTHRFLDGTGIDGLVRNANTAGIDFKHYFDDDRKWFLSTAAGASNLAGSTTAIENLQYSSVHYYQRPDADYVEVDPTRTSLNGYGGNVQAGRVGGHWNFMTFGYFKSPGYDLNDVGYLQSADALLTGIWSAYSFDKPFSIFRQIRPNFNAWTGWDYGGTHLFTGGNLNIYTEFKNLWSTSFGANYEGESLSNTLLRGGPSMLTPANMNYFASFGTNSSKMVYSTFWINGGKGKEESSESWAAGFNLTAKPGQSFSVTLSPSFSKNSNTIQYVTYIPDDDRYILSQIDQQVVRMSIRLNYNITPDLTIQYWGQPFLAAMDYSRYKVVTDPRAESLADRYHIFTDSEITYDEENNEYDVDENNAGTTTYSFSNPDYNYDEFLSNLVARWEFRPGSTLYLVWSQTRNYYEPTGSFSLDQNLNKLYTAEKPYNVFLIKFTYRFGLR
jgi:hypothetical protein